MHHFKQDVNGASNQHTCTNVPISVLLLFWNRRSGRSELTMQLFNKQTQEWKRVLASRNRKNRRRRCGYVFPLFPTDGCVSQRKYTTQIVMYRPSVRCKLLMQQRHSPLTWADKPISLMNMERVSAEQSFMLRGEKTEKRAEEGLFGVIRLSVRQQIFLLVFPPYYCSNCSLSDFVAL